MLEYRHYLRSESVISSQVKLWDNTRSTGAYVYTNYRSLSLLTPLATISSASEPSQVHWTALKRGLRSGIRC
jgi:hypothetical protein